MAAWITMMMAFFGTPSEIQHNQPEASSIANVAQSAGAANRAESELNLLTKENQ